MKEQTKISRRNFLKRSLAVATGVGLVGKVLESDAKANRLKLLIAPTQQGSINSSECNIDHHSWFNTDQEYLEGPEPMLDIYVYTGDQALGRDGEPAESMDPKTVYISGRGTSGPTEADVTDDIRELFDEENMIGKKIIGRLYQRVDDGRGGFNYNHVRTYDLWKMHESGQKINLTVNDGISRGQVFYPSHKLEISFNHNNKADFNNDGNVNLKDFSLLSARSLSE